MGSKPPIMRSIRLAALACIVVAAAVNFSFSQNATEIPLPEIIGRASEQRTAYQDVFKNLLSRETKTSETYKKNGEVKKQRTIVSTFLVYQLSKDANRISDFLVQEVDLEMDPPTPFQIGGDFHCVTERMRVALAARRIRLVDFYAPPSGGAPVEPAKAPTSSRGKSK